MEKRQGLGISCLPFATILVFVYSVAAMREMSFLLLYLYISSFLHCLISFLE